MTTFFLHGLDSSGSGTKGRYFGQHFPAIQRPDFTGTLTERLRQLERLVTNEAQLQFIGSSFGGLMATCFAGKHQDRVERLILLAPALNFAEFMPPPEPVMIPTLVVIGEHDTVTPPQLVLPLARAIFGNLDIRLLDDDHMLHQTFFELDWQQLLAA